MPTTWIPDTTIHRGQQYLHPDTHQPFLVARTPRCASRPEYLVVELESLGGDEQLVVPHHEFVVRWMKGG